MVVTDVIVILTVFVIIEQVDVPVTLTCPPPGVVLYSFTPGTLGA